MNGTEWTRSGRGSLLFELYAALWLNDVPPSDEAFGHLEREAKRHWFRGWSHRTNLRLTGEPLLADAVKRIAEVR